MTARRVARSIIGVALLAAALALALGGGGHAYRIRLALANAGGLRSGSDVTIGGVKAGTVSVRLDGGERVIADLYLDRSRQPVGKDASAAISAVNFLGQKRVELDAGTKTDPAPSGYVIPASRVTTSTDLDQVLDVLDAGTRARLTILIDEAGAAFTGRRADFSQLLQQLPHSMVRATALLNELVSDNHTLAHLLERSDSFVSDVAGERKSLARMLDVVGQTAATVAARRTQLRQTLATAPGTLATLQRFLGDLRATTVPLGPAARDITAAAPALSATLAELDPFRRAADPALLEATAVAPELTHLAIGATPVLRQAIPAADALAGFGTALTPVSDTLNHSIDNILAVVENWSRAIQFRDGLSHVFRGEALFTPETLRSIIDRLVPSKTRQRTAGRPAPQAAPSSPERATAAPAPPAIHLPRLGDTVSKTLSGVTQTLSGVTQRLSGVTQKLLQPQGSAPGGGQSDSRSATRLLDFLLGR